MRHYESEIDCEVRILEIRNLLDLGDYRVDPACVATGLVGECLAASADRQHVPIKRNDFSLGRTFQPPKSFKAAG